MAYLGQASLQPYAGHILRMASNAFLAFFYYAVPRLANRPVLSRKLGWLLFCIWNFAVVLPGWVLVCPRFSASH